MTHQHVELLAAYWTIAGDVYPMGPTEVSPFSFRDRMEAAGQAGFKGIGLVHNGMMATMDEIGYPAMKTILKQNGIEHIELEFLVDWYHSGERRRQWPPSDSWASARKMKPCPPISGPASQPPTFAPAFVLTWISRNVFHGIRFR